MMREAGIRVNGIPKIHVEDPRVDNRSLYSPETVFRIPLALLGVLFYFPTSQTVVTEITTSDNIYLLTTDRWNPHNDRYVKNEE